MHLGFAGMNTPTDLHPGVLAREMEDRGFESLWYGEHSHIPVTRLTPHPSGEELPEIYKWMMNPFLSLLLAATATQELRIGTAVALPLEHDLLDLAKIVSTLDVLSGGRFMFGVGTGWNREELANHRPIGWADRYQALDECIEALRVLWSDDRAEFHGQHYNFGPVWSYPKPTQKPHPPVWFGTSGPNGMAAAVRWADGWLPIDKAMRDPAKEVRRFREAVGATGRDPELIPITMVTFGNPDFARLATFRELGIERVVVGNDRTDWDDSSTTLPVLDHYAEMIPNLV
jgi:probable F420-dependent oxidoreductase